jgi:hypothetical protein
MEKKKYKYIIFYLFTLLLLVGGLEFAGWYENGQSTLLGLFENYQDKVSSAVDDSKDDEEEVVNSYHDACLDGDFDLARTILDKIHNQYNMYYSKGRVENAEKYAGRYATGAKFVFGQEISYWATQDPKNLNIKMVEIFNNIQTLGMKQGEYTPYKSRDQVMDFDCYVLYVDLKNTLAMQILNYAIQFNDKDLAMSAYHELEDNTHVEDYDPDTAGLVIIAIGNNKGKFIFYSDDDKSKAKEMIKKAFPDQSI